MRESTAAGSTDAGDGPLSGEEAVGESLGEMERDRRWARCPKRSRQDHEPGIATIHRNEAWVSHLGEFNEHLTRDFGAAQIGLGLAAIMVARQCNRGGIIAMMTAYIVFGLLHLGFHFTRFDHFHTASAVSQAIALATFIIIPAGILLTLRRH